MNNSQLNIEELSPEVDRKPALRERESELVKIIESLRKVEMSSEWSSLKKYVFDGHVVKLEKELLDEAKKDRPDNLALARLNGQLLWAKKYADLAKLADLFRLELTRIRLILYGNKAQQGEPGPVSFDYGN